jgi:hypothetical protein
LCWRESADTTSTPLTLSNTCGNAASWCATARADHGCQGCVRITLGSPSTTDRLLAALQEVLRETWTAPGSEQKYARTRKGTIERRASSKETDIAISLAIDGRSRYRVSTGIRFFDHMLELFAHHGGFDLELEAKGDLDVDQHHTVEDVGIALGQVFREALGSKKGILRAGYFLMPMDETLALAAVDFSGRTAAVIDTKVKTRVGGRSAIGAGV